MVTNKSLPSYAVGMNERMAGLMKTRRNGMNEELRPEYDLGQLHSRMKTRGSETER
jgi:hypothetical protein